jgi:uncharacterized protein
MSGSLHAWLSRGDLETLAGRGGEISGELALSKLTRLIGMLHSEAGSVRASLRFSQRRDRWLGLEMRYEASVELTCQRCLEPFRRELSGDVKWVLADADSMSAAVPDGYEAYELTEGRLSPAQLIEDELIVSIPLAPKHERLADCGSVARSRLMTEESDPAGAAGQ